MTRPRTEGEEGEEGEKGAKREENQEREERTKRQEQQKNNRGVFTGGIHVILKNNCPPTLGKGSVLGGAGASDSSTEV